MGHFKDMHQDIMNTFSEMFKDQVSLIKKEYPHITTEAAKLMALDTVIPQFFMYALKVLEPKQQESIKTEEPTKKETKNVKRRVKKEQSNGAETQLKFTDIT